MEIKITLFAALRDYGPPNIREGENFILNIEEESDISTVLDILSIPRSVIKIIMINGEIVTNLTLKLRDNDEISIIPPLGGG